MRRKSFTNKNSSKNTLRAESPIDGNYWLFTSLRDVVSSYVTSGYLLLEKYKHRLFSVFSRSSTKLPSTSAIHSQIFYQNAQSELWENFLKRNQCLNNNRDIFRERYHRGSSLNLEALKLENPEKYKALEKASNTIRSWYQKLRISHRIVHFNLNGDHSDEFDTFLNDHTKIPKILSYDQDQALLRKINQADWSSPVFRNSNTHLYALNLFSSNKITRHQKATISFIIETSCEFGNFKAYPILIDKEFTTEAKQHLFSFLRKKGNNNLLFDDSELDKFKNLVLMLPLSERFYFIFEQKRDNQGSSPSAHNPVRDAMLIHSQQNDYRSLNALNIKQTSSRIQYEYEGLLFLSSGAQDALGLTTYGLESWFSLIHRLGYQTIDNVDYFVAKQARSTFSGDSRFLKLIDSKESIHSALIPYPDAVIHDEFHRISHSKMGRDLQNVIELIIALIRETFGYRWSKDIWLLRDAGFTLEYSENLDITEYSTKLLNSFLTKSEYQSDEIANCPKRVKKELGIFLFKSGLPSQTASCFVIDLILNPQKWNVFHISNDEKYYTDPYKKLIMLAKFLKENIFFSENR